MHRLILQPKLPRTFRTEQVAGLFDLALDDLASERFAHCVAADVPTPDEPWKIGAIVGPSGSGKSSLARVAFGAALPEPDVWPDDLPLIEVLDRVPAAAPRTLHDLSRVLTAVGLASLPTWLKPYRVLSTGERMRADLARAILAAEKAGKSRPRVVVFDEFTSCLDRTVARTLCCAVARLLRGKSAIRLVAVSCHADIAGWLAPDWIVDLSPRSVARRAYSRSAAEQPIGQIVAPADLGKLPIVRARQMLWPRFAPHHYLAGNLSRAATCYAALWEGEPIAFCAIVAALGWRQTKRISRLVVLPEFQGLGIGRQLAEQVAAHEAARGNRVTITASHPAIVGACSNSPRWKYLGVKRTGSTRQMLAGREVASSRGRCVASFEFVREG
jgi:ABC-type transporter Mla maintaining outer membrane lipid asymmetry ATPase subunit MlaF/GNAT superfamily N-acetyltransferase